MWEDGGSAYLPVVRETMARMSAFPSSGSRATKRVDNPPPDQITGWTTGDDEIFKSSRWGYWGDGL